MIAPFDEGRLSNETLDPLAEIASHDFPFDEVFRELDGDDGDGAARREEMARAMRVLLEWMARPLTSKVPHDHKLQLIGRRVLAALWVVTPDVVGDVSASELGRRVGVHKALISETVCEFTRRFGVRNRFQSHGRNGGHDGAVEGDTEMSDTLREELSERDDVADAGNEGAE